MTAGSPIDGHHFAGLEVGHNLARHGLLVAGRTVPNPLTTPGRGEGAEAAQLDSIAVCQGRANLLEHRAHDPLDVAQ